MSPILVVLVVVCIVVLVAGMLVVGRSRSREITVEPIAFAPTTYPEDVKSAALALIAQGNKLAAIKLVHERTGAGLPEAKSYVDGLARSQPIRPVVLGGDITGNAIFEHPTKAPKPVAKTSTTAVKRETSGDLESQLRELITQGQKIAAIKLVREHTDMGLKEAKDMVEGWPGTMQTIHSSTTITTSGVALSGDLESELRELITQGKKIAAIKLVRERTGIGLKEAKDFVEGMPAELQITTLAGSLPQADLEKAVGKLLAGDQKVMAVQLVYEQTGLDLEEAKDLVERWQANPQQTTSVKNASMPRDEMINQARALLAKNQKIVAIKLVREQTGMGLKEAKDFVESL